MYMPYYAHIFIWLCILYTFILILEVLNVTIDVTFSPPLLFSLDLPISLFCLIFLSSHIAEAFLLSDMEKELFCCVLISHSSSFVFLFSFVLGWPPYLNIHHHPFSQSLWGHKLTIIWLLHYSKLPHFDNIGLT